jgi:hypothetical protein
MVKWVAIGRLAGPWLMVSEVDGGAPALNSYLTFCKLHEHPIEPTKETLSFFTVFMSSYIKSDLVNSYLSGICNQLQPFFPLVWERRNSALVFHTLAGCMRCFGTPTVRKQPLSTADLKIVVDDIGTSIHHNDKLLLAILLTRFHRLLHPGELTFPDALKLRNHQQSSM